MTRRERLERKLAKRAEWAQKAEARSQAAWEASNRAVEGIPPGQPILVGHHSEKRHRKALERSWNALGRSCKERDLAKHHESKADGLENQLERSVFSDDADAIAQLEARIAEREAERDRYKAVNTAWKKAGKPRPEQANLWHDISVALVSGKPENEPIHKLVCEGQRNLTVCPYYDKPFPAYVFSNLSANIRRDKERIEEIKRRTARTQAAEAAGGVAITQHGEYSRVTFAEKPPRATIDALKAAGFMWGGGSWTGQTEKLPEEVTHGR